MDAREITLWRKNGNGYCGLVHIAGTKTETRDRHDALIESWARPYLTKHLKGKLPASRLWTGISRYQAHWHHKGACEALGIKDYTLRDARHSWAVRARKQGRSFEAIAEQLGNTVYQVSTVYAAFKLTLDERKATPRKARKSTQTATRKTEVKKPLLRVMGVSR
jgi:integrase